MKAISAPCFARNGEQPDNNDQICARLWYAASELHMGHDQPSYEAVAMVRNQQCGGLDSSTTEPRATRRRSTSLIRGWKDVVGTFEAATPAPGRRSLSSARNTELQ